MGKWASSKREAFKREVACVQVKHVPVGVKAKAGRRKECWMAEDIDALVTKKKTYFTQAAEINIEEEYGGCWSALEREVG